MDVPVLIHITLSIGIASIAHWRSHHYLMACCFVAMFATVAFQIIAYLEAGYLDPLFFIATIVSGAVSLLIALLIGLPFLLLRKRRDWPKGSE